MSLRINSHQELNKAQISEQVFLLIVSPVLKEKLRAGWYREREKERVCLNSLVKRATKRSFAHSAQST